MNVVSFSGLDAFYILAIAISVLVVVGVAIAIVITVWYVFTYQIIEPPHEKTNNLHMRKQRRRSASR